MSTSDAEREEKDRIYAVQRDAALASVRGGRPALFVMFTNAVVGPGGFICKYDCRALWRWRARRPRRVRTSPYPGAGTVDRMGWRAI